MCSTFCPSHWRERPADLAANRTCVFRFSSCGKIAGGHLVVIESTKRSVLPLNKVSAAAMSLQSCPTVQPHRQQPTRLPRPWDSPGKNTGVGCHFLLQCMKVKSESEIAQSCLTPSDPMDCSPPGSSIHGIFQARVLEWGAIAFSTRFLTTTFL